MKEFIKLIAEIVNTIHDVIMEVTKGAGFQLTDKDLHLWVFGIIGIITFFAVHLIFKHLAQFSITAISFIYTFTVILVVVFAIEIQQKVTGRGQMDFADAIVSIWGFLLFFAVYLLVKGLVLGIKKLMEKKNSRKQDI